MVTGSRMTPRHHCKTYSSAREEEEEGEEEEKVSRRGRGARGSMFFAARARRPKGSAGSRALRGPPPMFPFRLPLYGEPSCSRLHARTTRHLPSSKTALLSSLSGQRVTFL